MARILCIEDEPVLRFIMAEWLEDKGHEVKLAENGLSALQWLSDGYIPDVIFLDLNLPVLSGRELLPLLADNSQWSSIPVYIVSAESTANISPHLYRQVIEKPFDLEYLSRIVAETVRQSD